MQYHGHHNVSSWWLLRRKSLSPLNKFWWQFPRKTVTDEFDKDYQMTFTSMSIEAVHVEPPGVKSRTLFMPNVLGKTWCHWLGGVTLLLFCGFNATWDILVNFVRRWPCDVWRASCYTEVAGCTIQLHERNNTLIQVVWSSGHLLFQRWSLGEVIHRLVIKCLDVLEKICLQI
jgi:hypothetical protein